MRRRLFTILSVVSLAFCAATVLCWIFAEVTHQRAFVSARWEDHQTSIHIRIRAHGWCNAGLIDGYEDGEWTTDLPSSSLDPVRQILRRDIGKPDQTLEYWTSTLRNISTPGLDRGGFSKAVDWEVIRFSNLAIAFAMLPLIWLALHIYRKPRSKTDPAAIKCKVCGYDLRATPRRCPECGNLRRK